MPTNVCCIVVEYLAGLQYNFTFTLKKNKTNPVLTNSTNEISNELYINCLGQSRYASTIPIWLRTKCSLLCSDQLILHMCTNRNAFIMGKAYCRFNILSYVSRNSVNSTFHLKLNIENAKGEKLKVFIQKVLHAIGYVFFWYGLKFSYWDVQLKLRS